MILLVMVSGILILPAMAVTLDIKDAAFSDIGETQKIEITLVGATDGPGGYVIQLELEDPTLAEITSVDFPSWATLNGTSMLPSADCTLTAAEIPDVAQASWNRIANVTIKAKNPGTTTLRVDESYEDYQIMYEDGTRIKPTIKVGTIAIKDKSVPGPITNLQNTTTQTSITWTWTDPKDADFDHVEVYFDGVFKVNVSKGIQSYNAIGLAPSSSHEIATRTADTSGNVYLAWVSDTATTKAPDQGDTTGPGPVTNLMNATQHDSITWTWTDPTDPDFAYVKVYLDGVEKVNVPKGIRSYLADSGLLPSTSYKIETLTFDTSGNPGVWVNQTATTKSEPDTNGPGPVTNLTNTTQQTSITWTWDDPTDSDFDHVAVYLGTNFKENVPKGDKTYTAGSLTPSTSYEIKTLTYDTSGNPGVWVNQTATTQATGATGSLWISSSPRSANVLIDGVNSGMTPIGISVAAGQRNVTLTKPGYPAKTTFVNVPANGQVRLNIIL